MTLRVAADGTRLEKLAADEPGLFKEIVERGQSHGVISHVFLATEDEILVIDEWPDEKSFQTFFAASPDIQEMMQRVGVTTEPEVKFWRVLDTHDRV